MAHDDRQEATSMGIVSNVSRAVYANLRQAILAGQIAGGSRLHQGALARRYGVSITPVREALSALVIDGLVDSTPYSGATVHQPTVREIDEVYQLRTALTPMLVEQSIESVTSGSLARATAIVERMTDPDFDGAWSEENRAFHRALEADCSNRQLVSVMNRLADLSLGYVALSVATSQSRKVQASEEHRQLLDLFGQRDVDAATAVALSHIEATHKLVRDALSSGSATDVENAPSYTSRV